MSGFDLYHKQFKRNSIQRISVFNEFPERLEMQHEMTIYVLPAVLALLIKLVVLFNSRSGTGRSTVFFTMVLIFAAHNSAELLGFLEYFKGAHLTNVLRWYYVMTVCVLAVMLLYAREVSTADRQNKYFNLGVAVVTVVVGSLILFTDLMIAGSTSLGFIMTAVKGPHYWIFSATVLLSFSAVTCYLVSGYRNAQDHLTEITMQLHVAGTGAGYAGRYNPGCFDGFRHKG